MTNGDARTLLLLGLPTLGLSLAITAVAVFVPVILQAHTSSSAVAGVIVGAEGILALVLPLLLGSISDRTRTRIGGRLPFLLVALVPCVGGLVAIPLAGSLGAIAASVAAFYVGYYVYYPPYRALFPDLVPRELLGRSQGVQTVFRELGLGAALVGAPLLLALSRSLPFVFAAALLVVVTVVLVVLVVHLPPANGAEEPHASGLVGAGDIRALLRRDPELVRLLVANGLWELSLGALKTFVVLYIVEGAGMSSAMASLLLGIVAGVALVAAPIAGHLADRHGGVRVSRIALGVYGIGLLLPAFTTSLFALLPTLPVVGFGGAVAMTLPYALVAARLPALSHGAGAGLYELSRGIGVMLGPILAGLAVDLARPWLPATRGYGAMWIVASAAVLASIPLLPRGEPTAARSERRTAANALDART